jgi:hypothetical protein
MPQRKKKNGPAGSVSRREFSFGVVMSAATVALPSSVKNNSRPVSDARTEELTGITKAQFEAILATHGSRLSNEEKNDIKRLVGQAQKTSDTLRAFALDNSNEPAMIFQAIRKEQR